jgi:hypothetical protein
MFGCATSTGKNPQVGELVSSNVWKYTQKIKLRRNSTELIPHSRCVFKRNCRSTRTVNGCFYIISLQCNTTIHFSSIKLNYSSKILSRGSWRKIGFCEPLLWRDVSWTIGTYITFYLVTLLIFISGGK